jgi:hypothetical protein
VIESVSALRAKIVSATKIAGNMSLYVENYNSGANLTVMCPNTTFWQDILTNVTSTLFNYYDSDGIYIDQIAAASAELCYADNHGHPTGGGSYWREGYYNLLKKAKATNPSKPVMTEENAEVYINSADAFLALQAFMEYNPITRESQSSTLLGRSSGSKKFRFGSDSLMRFSCVRIPCSVRWLLCERWLHLRAHRFPSARSRHC